MHRFLKGCLLSAVLWVAPIVSATTLVPLDLETMVAHSDSIVMGRVVTVSASWDTNHAGIYSVVAVDVDEPLKGVAEPRVVIHQRGGTVGEWHEQILGSPSFLIGESVLLFLERRNPGVGKSTAATSCYRTIGLNQGKYTVSSAGGLSIARQAAISAESSILGNETDHPTILSVQEVKSYLLQRSDR